uniref:Kit ligand n=1 Tax=Kryptolebias marmoratus TaxID=37003 RepID=A0A3Q3ALR5_KRYMA
MRKKIFNTTCFLLSLLSNLNLCSEKFGTPITDDVNKLSILKQNIPSDYEIPVSRIPKEVAGTCWVVLNIYPLEQSLQKFANMFGTVSSNKDNIMVFITMLKSLRFTFDHEELETAMQVFRCHYQEESLQSGLYFDYIQDLLHTATQGRSSLSCKPQTCLNRQLTPGTTFSYGSNCSWRLKMKRSAIRPPRLPECFPSPANANIPITALLLQIKRTEVSFSFR